MPLRVCTPEEVGRSTKPRGTWDGLMSTAKSLAEAECKKQPSRWGLGNMAVRPGCHLESFAMDTFWKVMVSSGMIRVFHKHDARTPSYTIHGLIKALLIAAHGCGYKPKAKMATFVAPDGTKVNLFVGFDLSTKVKKCVRFDLPPAQAETKVEKCVRSGRTA